MDGSTRIKPGRFVPVRQYVEQWVYVVADQNPWQAAKDAAEQLKEALNRAAHTSPADVADNVASGTQHVVHQTLGNLDNFINWCNSKV